MYPEKISLPADKNQRGSMLVLALFVIVVLAFLGLTLTKLLSAANDNVIYEVLGQRALNAARTGIECRLAQAAPCNSLVTKTFENVAGLENCRYDITDNDKTITDGSTILTYTQISSTGRCEVGNIVVSRTVYIDAINE